MAVRPGFRYITIGGMALALSGCAGGNSAPELDARAGEEPGSVVLGIVTLNGEICNFGSRLELQGNEKPNPPSSYKARYAARYALVEANYSSGRISKISPGLARPNMYLLNKAKCSRISLLGTDYQKFSFNNHRKVRGAKRFHIPAGKVVSLGVIEIKTPNPHFHKGRITTFSWTSRPFNQQELSDILKQRPDLAGRIEHYSESRIK